MSIAGMVLEPYGNHVRSRVSPWRAAIIQALEPNLILMPVDKSEMACEQLKGNVETEA